MQHFLPSEKVEIIMDRTQAPYFFLFPNHIVFRLIVVWTNALFQFSFFHNSFEIFPPQFCQIIMLIFSFEKAVKPPVQMIFLSKQQCHQQRLLLVEVNGCSVVCHCVLSNRTTHKKRKWCAERTFQIIGLPPIGDTRNSQISCWFSRLCQINPLCGLME